MFLENLENFQNEDFLEYFQKLENCAIIGNKELKNIFNKSLCIRYKDDVEIQNLIHNQVNNNQDQIQNQIQEEKISNLERDNKQLREELQNKDFEIQLLNDRIKNLEQEKLNQNMKIGTGLNRNSIDGTNSSKQSCNIENKYEQIKEKYQKKLEGKKNKIKELQQEISDQKIVIQNMLFGDIFLNTPRKQTTSHNDPQEKFNFGVPSNIQVIQENQKNKNLKFKREVDINDIDETKEKNFDFIKQSLPQKHQEQVQKLQSVLSSQESLNFFERIKIESISNSNLEQLVEGKIGSYNIKDLTNNPSIQEYLIKESETINSIELDDELFARQLQEEEERELENKLKQKAQNKIRFSLMKTKQRSEI
ncbi:UNKNOWN [Stylonychia lemnae]|uniref:Uncharacterized protein n=1 Tax=Stylonychia lemnae TaxID=5949 RepID=A0A078AYK7_STYLE|nr:UNKNOWN [Stylonychia lemnae]|eukprot:CDW87505.1 UNKNOWN [Stylonychia lemnae]